MLPPSVDAKPAHPLTPYPRGWYLAAHADEVAVRQVVPLRLFGRDLVVFRTDDGRAHITDAHCPHLGAHLGHGGRVTGECVRCPFHGWEFEADTGACVRTANGDPPPPTARLRTWEVDEQNGMILVWFHERGEPPTWHVPVFPAFDDPTWSRWSTTSWILRARIQDVSENDADVAHSPAMHGFTDGQPSIEMDTEGARCTYTLRAKIRLSAYGAPTLPAIGPIGPIEPMLPITIETLRWGLSLGWIRQWTELPFGLTLTTQTLGTTTPIDPDHVRVTFRHRVPKLPLPGATRVLLRQYARLFDRTAGEDVPIWENTVYRMRPVASRSDWAILRFRRWARQFYDPDHWDAAMSHELAAGERTHQPAGPSPHAPSPA